MTEKYAFIKVLITVDPPPMRAPLISGHDFPVGAMDENSLTVCQKWEGRLRSLFPNRRYLALANDINGRRVLASRFLRKIAPPQRVQAQLSHSARSAVLMSAQLVSSIPFIADSIVFPGVLDVWTSVDEMLKIGYGDEEEHCILLICWLLSMDIPAVMLLGHALPEGPKAAYG